MMCCPMCKRSFCFVCGLPKRGDIHDVFNGRDTACAGVCSVFCCSDCPCVREPSEARLRQEEEEPRFGLNAAPRADIPAPALAPAPLPLPPVHTQVNIGTPLTARERIARRIAREAAETEAEIADGIARMLARQNERVLAQEQDRQRDRQRRALTVAGFHAPPEVTAAAPPPPPPPPHPSPVHHHHHHHHRHNPPQVGEWTIHRRNSSPSLFGGEGESDDSEDDS